MFRTILGVFVVCFAVAVQVHALVCHKCEVRLFCIYELDHLCFLRVIREAGVGYQGAKIMKLAMLEQNTVRLSLLIIDLSRRAVAVSKMEMN